MSKNLFKYRMYGRRQARKKNNFNTNNKEKNVIEDINSKKIKFLKKNYNILDIGSGSGESTLHLNDRYPDSQIIACDNFKDGIELAIETISSGKAFDKLEEFTKYCGGMEKLEGVEKL